MSTFFFPFSTTLWKVSFVLSNGPVAWAIYMWKNSLVFHSLDKIISVLIHIMPPLVIRINRLRIQLDGSQYPTTLQYFCIVIQSLSTIVQQV